MLSFLQDLIQNNESLLLALGVFSVVSFFATLAIIPWLIVRLPTDYFARPTRYRLVSNNLPAGLHIVMLLLKNALGLLITVLGVLMLVIPGQGLLTMVIGLILMDFPGKYRLQRNLVQRQPVLKSVNWLREREHKPPLEFENHNSPSGSDS